MKNFASALVLVLIIFVSNSADSQVKFEKVYGGNGYDNGYSAIQTFDKGYIVAGATSSFGSGATDAYILKTDSLGDALWQKTFGGINIDQAYAINQTSDSGYVIAGYTNSYGNGGYDMYVIKTNKFGDTIWTKTYGGNNWDFAYSIEPTTDGGYIIAGGTYSYGKGNEDMYLVKINSLGDTLWTKTFGGAKDDEARSVKQTSDGGFILTGFSKSKGDTLSDFYTVKTNNMGDTLWTKKNGGNKEDFAFDIIEANSGGYYISGKTKSFGSGNYDGLVIKLSPAGVTTDTIIGGGTDDDGFNSITQSADGRLAEAGYTYSYGYGHGTSEFLLYIENPFNGFHSGTFGGNGTEIAYSIKNTKDKGYIICGNSNSYSNLDHIYLIKTDSNGVASGNVVNVITNINSAALPNTNLKIFPNPADNNVYLNINNREIINNNICTITVSDIFGRKLYEEIINNNLSEPIKITTSVFCTGIYLVNIESKGLLINQKLIIQH